MLKYLIGSDESFGEIAIGQTLANFRASERLRVLTYRLISITTMLAIPLWLIYWFEDWVYAPEQKWEFLQFRILVVLFLALSSLLILRVRASLSAVQMVGCGMVALHSLALTYLIHVTGDLKSSHWADINLIPIAMIAMIPWNRKFLILALLTCYFPYYLVCVFLDFGSVDRVNLLVYSFFNFSVATTAALIQQIADLSRENECELRFQLNTEVQERNKIIEKKAAEAVDLKIGASLGKLAAQVAHDIRSPVAALETLSNQLKEIHQDQQVLLRLAVSRISEIANELLATHRVTHQGGASRLPDLAAIAPIESTVLLPLVQQVVTEHKFRLPSKSKISLVEQYGNDALPISSRVSPQYFKRVISILVENALESFADYSDSGIIEISLSRKEQTAMISVRDNGKGIPEKLMSTIGNERVTYGKPNGSGLGLHFVKAKVEEWGGTISIDSKQGSGTKVAVILPLE